MLTTRLWYTETIGRSFMGWVPSSFCPAATSVVLSSFWAARFTEIFVQTAAFNYKHACCTIYSAFGKLLCTCKRCWKWCPRTIVSKNWIKQLHTLLVLHFSCCSTTEYGETMATLIMTIKSVYHSLSAQRLAEHIVHCDWLRQLKVLGSTLSVCKCNYSQDKSFVRLLKLQQEIVSHWECWEDNLCGYASFFVCRDQQNEPRGFRCAGCGPVLSSEVFLIFSRSVFPSFSRGRHFPVTQQQSFTSQKTESSVCSPILTEGVHIYDVSVQDVKVSQWHAYAGTDGGGATTPNPRDLTLEWGGW
jgi:hypothetical protein